jgi:prepilin-type processing-associated H-X9-DG protein
MTPLNDTQKHLLFDYCLGLTTETENAQAQELVFSNDQAARFVSSLKAVLSPLDSIADEQCPQELAEGTIWRAQQAVRTGRVHLNELIAAEQRKKTSFWRETFGRLATAAMFVIVGSVVISGGKMAANYARQYQCSSKLAGLYQSLSNYQNDNNGRMPAVATEAGAPWWKVSYQGPENVSNTRKMWLLVKNGYARPEDFMCPAQKTGQTFACNPRDYNDFPQRKLVVYSFRIGCPQGMTRASRQIIVSDMNPIFKDLPSPNDPGLSITLCDRLLKQNSPNHNGRGQNVLFCDGSVRFVRTRYVDSVSRDDIFTIQGPQTYEGTEMPTSEADAFLAP